MTLGLRCGQPHLETRAGRIPARSLGCEFEHVNSTEGRTSVSGTTISIVLAATALAVSVLFATPLGQAASRFVLPKNSVGRLS
jgi:hypothetical protein